MKQLSRARTTTPTILSLTLASALLLTIAAGASTVDDALNEALADERLARATYQAVIDAHDGARPFVNVVRGEQRHIDMLLELYASRGLTAPADPYAAGATSVTAPTTVRDACRDALDAEKRNIAIYDRLLSSDGLDADVVQVFQHLRMASLEHHMPAFDFCLERGGGKGRGRNPKRTDAALGDGCGGSGGAGCCSGQQHRGRGQQGCPGKAATK